MAKPARPKGSLGSIPHLGCPFGQGTPSRVLGSRNQPPGLTSGTPPYLPYLPYLPYVGSGYPRGGTRPGTSTTLWFGRLVIFFIEDDSQAAGGARRGKRKRGGVWKRSGGSVMRKTRKNARKKRKRKTEVQTKTLLPGAGSGRIGGAGSVGSHELPVDPSPSARGSCSSGDLTPSSCGPNPACPRLLLLGGAPLRQRRGALRADGVYAAGVL